MSNVNLLSMTTPSDLINDDTGRLTPVTDTVLSVLTLEAAFNYGLDSVGISTAISMFSRSSDSMVLSPKLSDVIVS